MLSITTVYISIVIPITCNFIHTKKKEQGVLDLKPLVLPLFLLVLANLRFGSVSLEYTIFKFRSFLNI